MNADELLREARIALGKTIWKGRTVFPNNPYCSICGAGFEWAQKNGHQSDCIVSRIDARLASPAPGGGGVMSNEIKYPWIIVHQPDGPNGQMVTLISSDRSVGYEGYALVVADIVRHIGKAFDVDEHDVMRWVDREMNKPTTTINGSKVS